MKTHQKRTIAFVLPVLSIGLSFVLWAEIVRSLMPPIAGVISVEDTDASLSAASDTAVGVVVESEPARPPAPLMPSMHFAASAASRAVDQQKRDELLQWEIQESYNLSIPSLSIRASVFLPSRRHWDVRDWETLERQMQVGLLYGVVAYPHAAEPGERGTIVIAGHSSPPNDRARASRFGTVFASLPTISLGEQIVLRTSHESVTYTVVDTMIVPAGDTTILLSQQDESVLKLITCYPIGSTKDRFVVIAKKIAL
ncbi:MAG: sortase [Candidatus Peregrinibacteria bacterium]